jgi:hypothetical protein
MLAERIGSIKTYYYLIVVMVICLVISPQTANYMDHDGAGSSGCDLFIALLCIVGMTVRALYDSDDDTPIIFELVIFTLFNFFTPVIDVLFYL